MHGHFYLFQRIVPSIYHMPFSALVWKGWPECWCAGLGKTHFRRETLRVLGARFLCLLRWFVPQDTIPLASWESESMMVGSYWDNISRWSAPMTNYYSFFFSTRRCCHGKFSASILCRGDLVKEFMCLPLTLLLLGFWESTFERFEWQLKIRWSGACLSSQYSLW